MTRNLLFAVTCFAVFGLVRADDASAPPRVSVSKLVATFQWNEALADEQYRGKVVEVTGQLRRVSRSKYGSSRRAEPDYAVELLSDDGRALALPVLFFFTGEHRKRLSECRPQQPLTIRGKCWGRMVSSAPPGSDKEDYSEVQFRDCELLGKE
jgi:hypothetical protein